MLDSEDFDFVLEQGQRYWFVVRGSTWNRYRKVLKATFGKRSFRTVKTEEETVATDDRFGGDGPREVLATFVVLEVGSAPIMVSAEIMGAPHDYSAGDNAQSVGAFETPEPHWIVKASELTEKLRRWAEAVREKGEDFGETVAKKAGELAKSPEKFMQKIEGKAFKIMILATVAGIGALAVYRVTTSAPARD